MEGWQAVRVVKRQGSGQVSKINAAKLMSVRAAGPVHGSRLSRSFWKTVGTLFIANSHQMYGAAPIVG